jgi:carbon-monoxide dehydrogenase medium subunit
VALGATMLLEGPEGRRAVPVTDFFRYAFRTDLRPGELLAGMEIPSRTEVRWGYAKLKASESSWPIITAAARLEMAGAERRAVVSVGGAAGIPVTVTLPWPEGRERVEESDRVLIDDQLADTVGMWWEDELADSRYRRRVAAVIATRAVEAALAEGGRSPSRSRSTAASVSSALTGPRRWWICCATTSSCPARTPDAAMATAAPARSSSTESP